MDPDEIGGSCPRCDAEFRPGVTECPVCGIPLLGVGEAPPTVPSAPGPPKLALPPAWADRLDLVAAACAVAVLLALFGSLVSALAFHVEGLSYQEAAETLGVPVGTVTSRVARAREALQELLGEWP